MSLNLFPSHVSLGSVQVPDQRGRMQKYDVTASAEFVRALSDLFVRIGGPNGMSSDDLALLGSLTASPDISLQRSVDELKIDRATDQTAEIAVMKRTIQDLQTQVDGMANVVASIAAMQQKLKDVEVLATHRDVFRVNWERPGKLGSLTANSVDATTLTASAAVTLSPDNANVVLSPTGSGLVTINPATTGAMDNVVIGANTSEAATVTTLNGNTITAGSGTLTLGSATLDIGVGGTLGSAAFTDSTDYVPANAPVVADGTIATIEQALKSNNIMS